MVLECLPSKTVCVIGAGPSGLVAARELRKEGHAVSVVEQSRDVGGQWLYDPSVDQLSCEKGSSLLGPRDGANEFLRAHSSVYESLRLKSPRETMGFTDFPFSAKKGRDSRRFPGHREVYLYLRDFCECFGLRDLIRFNTRVEYVGMVNNNIGQFDDHDHHGISVVGSDLKWLVRTRDLLVLDDDDNKNNIIINNAIKEEVFDAVVVATGHYSFPKLPSFKESKCTAIADTVIYCTGYSYKFPFLDTQGIVCVDDDRVGPLFEHTFPPSLAPSLTFIAIPRKIIGFPFFESQAKWIAQVLSGKRRLPSWDDMMKSIKEFYLSRELAGIPKQDTHDIADFEYCDRYGDYVGFPHLEEWRKVLCISAISNSWVNLETYRDSYDHDHDLLQEAFQSPHFTQQPVPQALSI